MSRSDLPAALTSALLALQSEEFHAMVLADVSALDALLAPQFTLTHMTGFVQSKADWLSDVDTDRMSYHAVDLVDSVLTGSESGPVMTVQTLTEATIWGAHSTWRLQLRSTFMPDGDGWIIARTVASTW